MSMGRVRLNLVAGIAILLALAALLWFLVLSPRLSKAAELSAQAAQLQGANLSLQNQYNKALALADKAPQAAADAQALFATMPDQAELPAVLEQVTAAATDAGIKPQDIQTINAAIPNPIEAQAYNTASGINLAQMELSVTAEGKRDQSLAFLDNLQGLDRALLITSNRLANVATVDAQPGASNRESIQVVGQMFVLQSKLPDLVQKVDDLLAAAGRAPTP
jgi:Tfp pilus assembly protein PilO